jgi:flagellar basal body-associated protein FliL
MFIMIVVLIVLLLAVIVLSVFLVNSSKKVKGYREEANHAYLQLAKVKENVAYALATTKKGYLKAGLKRAVEVMKEA